jgi:hypothetical protein
MFQTRLVEKIKIYLILKIFSENLAFYEIIMKNILEPDRPQITYQKLLGSCLSLSG